MARKLTLTDLMIARAFQAWCKRPGRPWEKYGVLESRRDALTAIVAARQLHPGVRFCLRRRGLRPPMDDGACISAY